ncbi:TlpA family protein disulfide reductase [Endozoicomonas acroporae]|uniref:TlpA family protein disulfide reductase n=1 Tax=Endozoicomonas acroporae TaxID=1701104 RepID=UPI0013D083C9|nr:TlpA disulfide reductase family protein [Endozoicomonas acroporae]
MRITRTLEYFLVVVLLGAVVACSKPVTFADLNGNPVAIASENGQWLALNFWAEWCDPCREEIPELNELASDGQVRVLGVDFDSSQGDALIKKAKALDIRFPVLQESPLAVLNESPPQVLPATYIISPEGKVVTKLFGPQTRKSLEEQIHKLSKHQLQETSSNG